MRSAAAATVAALSAARDTGIVPRVFFWATVRDRETNEPVERGFWSGDRTVTIEVISGLTGALEERTYVGGVNLAVGDIARVADLTIQTVDVELSAIAAPVQALVRGYDARLARVEIHSGLLDPRTRAPVAAPEIDFLGEIDGAPIETGAAGGDSVVRLQVRSDAISMLTRRNPRKRSHEGQKRRSNDQFGRFGNAVKTWSLTWGAEEQKQT